MVASRVKYVFYKSRRRVELWGGLGGQHDFLGSLYIIWKKACGYELWQLVLVPQKNRVEAALTASWVECRQN